MFAKVYHWITDRTTGKTQHWLNCTVKALSTFEIKDCFYISDLHTNDGIITGFTAVKVEKKGLKYGDSVTKTRKSCYASI